MCQYNITEIENVLYVYVPICRKLKNEILQDLRRNFGHPVQYAWTFVDHVIQILLKVLERVY